MVSGEIAVILLGPSSKGSRKPTARTCSHQPVPLPLPCPCSCSCPCPCPSCSCLCPALALALLAHTFALPLRFLSLPLPLLLLLPFPLPLLVLPLPLPYQLLSPYLLPLSRNSMRFSAMIGVLNRQDGLHRQCSSSGNIQNCTTVF